MLEIDDVLAGHEKPCKGSAHSRLRCALCIPLQAANMHIANDLRQSCAGLRPRGPISLSFLCPISLSCPPGHGNPAEASSTYTHDHRSPRGHP